MPDFLERIAEAEQRSHELEGQLSDPELAKQPGQYQRLAKKLGGLRPMVDSNTWSRSKWQKANRGVVGRQPRLDQLGR